MFKLLVLVVAVTLTAADIVERVNQNFDERLNTRITQQINYELQASYLYQAYAHYFDRADVALPGFSKWFSAASKEERTHAEGLIEYVNKRGGSISLGDIGFTSMCSVLNDELFKITSFGRSRACICSFMSYKKDKATAGDCGERSSWKNGLWAFQDTLALERFVNNELIQLHANAAGDPHFAHILEHVYLDEQVNAIKDLGDYIRQLERVGDGLGEYMFDKNL